MKLSRFKREYIKLIFVHIPHSREWANEEKGEKNQTYKKTKTASVEAVFV